MHGQTSDGTFLPVAGSVVSHLTAFPQDSVAGQSLFWAHGIEGVAEHCPWNLHAKSLSKSDTG